MKKQNKIIKVEYSNLPYKRILPQTKEKIYRDFKIMHGVDLRSTKEICKLMDTTDKYLYVFMLDCVITLTFKNGRVEQHTIKAGAFTDLASVPAWLRSFVDDNNPAIIAAALIHDFLYKTLLRSFRNANRYFKQIIKAERGSKFLQAAAFCAVSTFFGRKAYKKYKKTYKQNRSYYNIKILKAG